MGRAGRGDPMFRRKDNVRDWDLYDEAAVKSWRTRFVTGDDMFWLFQGWWRGLVAQPDFAGLSPSLLLKRLDDGDAKFARRLAGLIDDYTREKGGTKATMSTRRGTVRGFFKNHNLELPSTVFRAVATRKSVKARLYVATVKRIVLAATPRDQAVLLSIYGGLMDVERFSIFNAACGYELGKHILERGVDVLFKVEFDGRKMNPNPFFTYLGRDALCAWKEYFEKFRGYPLLGEAAALTTLRVRGKHTALSNMTVKQNYIWLIRHRVGLIPLKAGAKHDRYGYNIHEFRDVARTSAQTMYQKNGLTVEGRVIDFDPLAVEFFMGHEVDPLAYNKFYKDEEYIRRQYRIIERRLNIISNDPEVEEVRREGGEALRLKTKEIDDLRSTVYDLVKDVQRVKHQLEQDDKLSKS